MSLTNKDFKVVYSTTPATKAGQIITDAELRAPTVTSITCKVEVGNINDVRQSLEKKTFCGNSKEPGARSATFTLSYYPDDLTDGFWLALQDAYRNGTAIYIAEFVGTNLASGLGWGGNVKVFNFPLNAVIGTFKQDITLEAKVGEFDFLLD